MARVIKNKELTNTRLATNYGGWIYYTKYNENIGYLCYSTYDEITLDYQCKCGSIGKIKINFEDSLAGQKYNSDLITIKQNRHLGVYSILNLVGDRGVEPLTSSTSKTRSSQLS